MIPTPPTNLDSLLLRSCRYITDTWGPARGYNLGAAGLPVLSWTGGYQQELAVRGAAMAAVTLATPMFLGTSNYNGGNAQLQRDAAARLLAAVLRQHVSAPNLGGSFQRWGVGWQSPLWAAWAGLTAMLGWHDLIDGQNHRQNLYAMLETEADYVLDFPIEWWRMANGAPGIKHNHDGTPSNILRTEDSAAEENTWRAQALWVAAAIMPTHPRANAWRGKAVDLNIASFAHSSDGLPGYNVDNLYCIHNHSRVHPDYATNVAMNAFGWLVNSLNGYATSRDTLHNLVPVWDALQLSDLDSQGTRAYVIDDATVNFPIGTPSDWGWRRPHAYAVLDGLVGMLQGATHQTSLSPMGAPYWESLHLADAGNMQYRAESSSHPFGAFVQSGSTPPEASYPEEEVYASSQLAYLRLCRYVYARSGRGLLV